MKRKGRLTPTGVCAGVAACLVAGSLWVSHAGQSPPAPRKGDGFIPSQEVLAEGTSGSPSRHLTNFSSFLLLPLRVHLLHATNAPAVHTTLQPTDVERILRKVNLVWSAAGVHFYPESVVAEDATRALVYESSWKAGLNRHTLLALRPPESLTQNVFHVYYLKEMTANGVHFEEANFVKDTASLREVPGGIDEPLPRVTSHELGHALSLVHRQHETNLMASRTTGTALNAEEIQQARTNALSRAWMRRAGEMLGQADELFREGKKAEAAILYRRLSRLPISGAEVERARQRSN